MYTCSSTDLDPPPFARTLLRNPRRQPNRSFDTYSSLRLFNVSLSLVKPPHRVWLPLPFRHRQSHRLSTPPCLMISSLLSFADVKGWTKLRPLPTPIHPSLFASWWNVWLIVKLAHRVRSRSRSRFSASHDLYPPSLSSQILVIKSTQFCLHSREHSFEFR